MLSSDKSNRQAVIYIYIRKVETFFSYLAMVAAFALMLLGTSDAIGRTFFNKPVPGATEIGEFYLMEAIVFLGLAYTYTVGGPVRMDILATIFGHRFRFATEFLSQIIGIILFMIITWYSLQFALDGLSLGKAHGAGIFMLPTYPAYFFVPFGSLLTIVSIVTGLIRNIIDFRTSRSDAPDSQQKSPG